MENFNNRFSDELAAQLAKKLAKALSNKTTGHRARVLDLPGRYIENTCRLLAAEMAGIDVYILSEDPPALPFISASKLIEMRNISGKVVLAFIPPGLKTPEEDSYGENNFENLSVQPALREIIKARESELCNLYPYLPKVLGSRHFRERRVPSEKILQYLFALKENSNDPLAPGKFLYLVGLIPDYALSDLRAEATIDRNSKVVSTLINPEKPLLTKIEDLTNKDPFLKPDSIQFELFMRLRENEGSDPDGWLVKTIDWGLTFDKWPFKEKEDFDQANLKFEFDPLEKFKGLKRDIKGEYWQAEIKEPISVTWKTSPPNHPALSHFMLNVLHFDRREELLPPKKVALGRRSLKINFKDLEMDEEGRALVYIEGRAVNTGGETIGSSAQSEPFWVMGEEDIPGGDGPGEDEVTDSNGEEARSTIEAALISALRARNKKDKILAVELKRERSGWVGSKAKDGEYDIYRLKMSTGDTFHLKIGKLLRSIEADILEHPENLRRFIIKSEDNFIPDQQIERATLTAGNGNFEEFLQARKLLFDAIRSKFDLIELADLLAFDEHIKNYARTYADLLNAKGTYTQISSLDTASFKLDGDDGVMLAPTHPLRILWLLQYQKLLSQWTQEILADKTPDKAKSFDRRSLDLISPLNQLAFLFIPDFGTLNNVDNLGLYWGVYLPNDNKGNKNDISLLYRKLGIPTTKVSVSNIQADQVGERINEYLNQHHYVKTLSINVINPGDGRLILDALRYIQGDPDQRKLNYDIRFFGEIGSNLEKIGVAFDELIGETEEGRSQDVDEAFLETSNNPLLPKMAFSRHFVSDWSNKGEFDAHITIILDHFNSTITTAQLTEAGESSGLDGLLLEYASEYNLDKGVAWLRSIQPGNTPDDNDAGTLSGLLASLQSKLLRAATKTMPGAKPSDVPAIALQLSDEDKDLLEKVHRCSDWVITIDRNFGAEYYDTPLSGQGNYLIDYKPDLLGEFGQRLIVSTASTNEIESTISKILKDKNLLTENSRPIDVLSALRAVSGRAAIQVLNQIDASDSLVIFGLMYKSLAENGALNDAILLPVENHPELFGDEAKNSLALVRTKGKGLELELVTFRSVEGDFIGEEYKVKEEIRQELEATKAALFDTYLNPSAPDHPVRIKVLTNILGYYLERVTRYGFIVKGSGSYAEFKATLKGLISGNQELTCAMRGLILKPSGVTQPVEDFHGIKIQVQGPSGFISHEPKEEPTEKVDSPGTKEAGLIGETPQTPQELPKPPLTTKEVPEETTNKTGDTGILEVLLGRRSDNGQPVLWAPSKVTPKRLTNQHILIVGKSGSGKTQTIYALVYELWRNGIPSLLLDFHGEYCDSNSAQFREAVKATVLDAAHGIPINPLTVPPDPLTWEPSDYRNVVYQVTESLADIFSLGDIQKRTLKRAVESTYTSAGFTRNPLTWARKAPAFGEVWQKLLEIEQEERGKAQNLVARVEPLFEAEVFTGDRETFEDAMGRVTIVRLSSLANKELRTAISRFFLQKVYEHMLSMGPAEKQRLFCVLDEAHKLSHDPTITDLIKEARKYGVGLVLSSQETKDFDRSIFANTGTLIALQLEVEDAKVMAENLGLLHTTERQAAIEILLRQQPGQALVRNNHYQPYVQVKIEPFLERIDAGGKTN